MDRTAYIPVKHDDDDYWTHDTPLFVGSFSYYRNEPRMVQGKLSVSEEPYNNNSTSVSAYIPSRNESGTRHYVHMKPYVLEPEMFLTVGLYPQPKHYADQDDAIGEVLNTRVKGMRQHDIGNAQAWYYPAEKTIVLWECFLESHVRHHSFNKDENQRQLWHAFEHWLIKQFPDATQLATPFNDPIAETIEEYQAFLRLQGFHPSPTAKAAFEKQIK